MLLHTHKHKHKHILKSDDYDANAARGAIWSPRPFSRHTVWGLLASRMRVLRPSTACDLRCSFRINSSRRGAASPMPAACSRASAHRWCIRICCTLGPLWTLSEFRRCWASKSGRIFGPSLATTLRFCRPSWTWEAQGFGRWSGFLTSLEGPFCCESCFWWGRGEERETWGARWKSLTPWIRESNLLSLCCFCSTVLRYINLYVCILYSTNTFTNFFVGSSTKNFYFLFMNIDLT